MKIELAGHYGFRRLALSSLPTIAMMIITSIYSVVDGYFVSNFAGSTEFAALNIVWPALALISALGLMIGTGGSALVSKTIGEGDVLKANRIFTFLIRISLMAGIVVTGLLFAFMKPVVLALGSGGRGPWNHHRAGCWTISRRNGCVLLIISASSEDSLVLLQNAGAD